MFGRKFGFRCPFMMEKIPHAIEVYKLLSFLCSGLSHKRKSERIERKFKSQNPDLKRLSNLPIKSG